MSTELEERLTRVFGDLGIPLGVLAPVVAEARAAIASEVQMATCTDPNCEPMCAGRADAVEVIKEGFEF